MPVAGLPAHHSLPRAAVAGLVVAVLLPRLLGLGTSLTIDEPLWLERGSTFMRALASLDFQRTFTHIHPGVTTAWFASLTDRFDSLAASQAAVALAVSLALLAVVYVIRRLTSFWFAVAAGAVFALDPFYVAHSRVVHLDALFATFVILSLLLLLLARKTNEQRYVIGSGVAGALALLTKVHTVVFLPIVLLLFLAGAPWRRARRRLALFLVALVVTTIALWPALWQPTRRNVAWWTSQFVSEATRSRERGGEGYWWYYPREFFFRTTPAVVVLAPVGMAVLAFATLLRRRRPRLLSDALERLPPFVPTIAGTLLAASLWYAGILSFASVKGDRWILIAYLTADFFALIGAWSLAAVIGSRLPRLRRMSFLLVVLLLGVFAVETWRLHPYPIAHYNRLYPLAEKRRLGWGEGLEQVAAYLNQRPDAGVPVVSYYPRVLAHFYRGRVERLVHAENSAFRYVVLYRSMFEHLPGTYQSDFLEQYLGREEPLHVVMVNGLPYAWVFENRDAVR